MKEMSTERYENYPLSIVIKCNMLSLSIYAIGIFVISKLGLVWLLLYLAYILFLEIRLLKGSCTSCCYYGKVCAMGRGKISGLFFKKGDPQKFQKMQVTWKDLIPDFLVSIIPLVTGIVLLIIKFDLFLLILLIILMLLASLGNSIVRTQFACRHCKQLDLGCPAVKLFSKEKK